MYENGIFSGKIHLNKKPARIEQEIPPMKPTTLLLPSPINSISSKVIFLAPYTNKPLDLFL